MAAEPFSPPVAYVAGSRTKRSQQLLRFRYQRSSQTDAAPGGNKITNMLERIFSPQFCSPSSGIRLAHRDTSRTRCVLQRYFPFILRHAGSGVSGRLTPPEAMRQLASIRRSDPLSLVASVMKARSRNMPRGPESDGACITRRRTTGIGRHAVHGRVGFNGCLLSADKLGRLFHNDPHLMKTSPKQMPAVARLQADSSEQANRLYTVRSNSGSPCRGLCWSSERQLPSFQTKCTLNPALPAGSLRVVGRDRAPGSHRGPVVFGLVGVACKRRRRNNPPLKSGRQLQSRPSSLARFTIARRR